MISSRWRGLAALPLSIAIAGCSTTSGHQPTSTTSGFDGARVINIEPHGAICTSMAGPCIGLGAEWSSASPSSAFLQIQITGTDYYSLQAASLNIDGAVQPLAPPQGATAYTTAGGGTFYESTRSFPVSVALVRQIASAQRVWVRVETPTGRIEGAVIDDHQDSKAYHAMGRFLRQVGQE